MLVARSIVSEIVPGTPILRVRGEIDEFTIDEFMVALASAESATKCGMIVDVGEAKLWSTAAYAGVVGAAARLAVAGNGPLFVVCGNAALARRVFRALRFEHRCMETVVAAIAALRCNGASLAVIYAESILRSAVS